MPMEANFINSGINPQNQPMMQFSNKMYGNPEINPNVNIPSKEMFTQENMEMNPNMNEAKMQGEMQMMANMHNPYIMMQPNMGLSMGPNMGPNMRPNIWQNQQNIRYQNYPNQYYSN